MSVDLLKELKAIKKDMPIKLCSKSNSLSVWSKKNNLKINKFYRLFFMENKIEIL